MLVKSGPEHIGIYVFYNNKEIYYVGRALKNTYFGSRIASHMTKKWYSKLDKDKTMIRFYIIDSENDFWLPSLELFLYNTLKPIHNKKRV